MTVLTNNPTANTGNANWTNPQNAYTDDATYCTTATRNINNTWSSYGFTNPGGGAYITKVEVGIKGYQNTGGDDQITIAYTNNNSTYTNAPSQPVTLPVGAGAESLTYYDVTWANPTWTEVDNTNFKVRLTTSRTGGTMTQQNINWLPVRVTYEVAKPFSYGYIIY